MQLSMLIGKPILSPNGEQLGYVTGAYLSRDFMKLSALVAVDPDEEEFILPARAVRACSDAVVAQKTRVTAPCGAPAPIGKHAYSEQGEDLGVVGDWLFGEGEPVLVLVKDGVRTSYPAKQALFDQSVIVYRNSRPAPKKSGTKRSGAKTAKQLNGLGTAGKTTEKRTDTSVKSAVKAADSSVKTDDITVKTANGNAGEAETDEQAAANAQPAGGETARQTIRAEETDLHSEETPAVDLLQTEQDAPSDAAASAKESEPVRYEIGAMNLLGKKVVRSVFDVYGNPVALAGERVTPEIVSRARKKGRLLALTVNTIPTPY